MCRKICVLNIRDTNILESQMSLGVIVSLIFFNKQCIFKVSHKRARFDCSMRNLIFYRIAQLF